MTLFVNKGKETDTLVKVIRLGMSLALSVGEYKEYETLKVLLDRIEKCEKMQKPHNND